MSLINQNVCLVLNGAWQAINSVCPEEAFVNLMNETQLGMVIEDEQMYPVDWDTWITLKPLTPEFTIHTSKLAIRIPTVIIAINYHKMPVKSPALTRDNIIKRDKYTCQYSKKKMDKKDLSLDHITPRSRGGRHSWQNLVACSREINFQKADRTPEEAGLLTPHVSDPPVVPVSLTIHNAHGIKDWDYFLVGKSN